MILHLVTSNRHKVEEYSQGLSGSGVTVAHLDADCHEIQADTLEEVVSNCMEQLRAQGHKDFMVDDSGLFIDALNDFPGVYSAYVMRTLGCDGVIDLISTSDDHGARFECCIGVSSEELGNFLVKGISPGTIIMERRGTGGFGYDPIFVPDGSDRTFAQMEMEEKNMLSHRGRAMKELAMEISRRRRERFEG